jgi:alkaline phosphatase
MEQAKARRMRTGNVTTAEVTDATPAGQYSHVSQRSCQGPKTTAACGTDAPIAEQTSRNNVADVILGGGLARFEPDDQDELQANGYTALGDFGDPQKADQTGDSQRVATRSDLGRVRGATRRVVGLFNRANLTVETFKDEHPNAVHAREPSLTEMTKKSIELLANSRQGSRRGFFLQVEGALIDKRSHANDAAQTLRETKEFDDAVQAGSSPSATATRS